MKSLNKVKPLIGLLAATSCLFSATCFSAITVYPISLGMKGSGSAQIQVMTNSNETEFVKTTIKKINNPGTSTENETMVSQSSGDTLIVTPAKFGLAPGTTRVIRLVNMQQPQSEVAYRVYFEGIAGLNDENTQGASTNKASLGVNMIWGVLVNVPPAQPRIDFTLNPLSRQVTNTGNIHLKITSIGLCPQSNTDTGCQWSKEVKKSIYPNQQAILDPSLFKGNHYSVVKVKYLNWVDKTSGEKEFNTK